MYINNDGLKRLSEIIKEKEYQLELIPAIKNAILSQDNKIFNKRIFEAIEKAVPNAHIYKNHRDNTQIDIYINIKYQKDYDEGDILYRVNIYDITNGKRLDANKLIYKLEAWEVSTIALVKKLKYEIENAEKFITEYNEAVKKLNACFFHMSDYFKTELKYSFDFVYRIR